MNFTYAELTKIYQLLREKKFDFSFYDDYKKSNKAVIIRHDVDISIEQAYRMACFEADMGVASTYFVLIRGDFYNPFNSRNQNYLNEILHMGHRIGLHFDETLYSQDDLVSEIQNEILIMSSVLKTDIKAVSMHIPSKKTLGSNYIIGDGSVVNSYSDIFFKEFKYISDSKMNWRENVYDIINSDQYSQIQLLTHPVWYHNDNCLMWDNVNQVLFEQLKNMYQDFNVHTNDCDKQLSFIDCIGEIYDKSK